MARPSVIVAISLLLATSSFILPAQKDKSQDRGRTLIGRVLNQQEEPIAKAVVSLKNTRTHVSRSYISDTNGAFHFGPLSPNVDYEVRAEFNGASSDTKVVSALDPRLRVELTLRIK